MNNLINVAKVNWQPYFADIGDVISQPVSNAQNEAQSFMNAIGVLVIIVGAIIYAFVDSKLAKKIIIGLVGAYFIIVNADVIWGIIRGLFGG